MSISKVYIARLGKGLTLKQVANMIDVSESYMSKIERGQRIVPKKLESVLELNNGTQWLERIELAVAKYYTKKERNEIMLSLYQALSLMKYKRTRA